MEKDKKIVFWALIIFIVLLLIIFFIIFMKNKEIRKNTETITWTQSQEILKNSEEKKLMITLITDKRNPETNLDLFLENLKNTEKFAIDAEIKKVDFSEDSVKKFLETNFIKKLPAIIFSTNDFESENNWPIDIKNYLTKIPSWDYFLETWASYDPFTASKRWFSTIETNLLENIKNDSFFDWEKNWKIIWLEYSDLACSFCKDFHNSWVIEKVLEKYRWEISKTINHFEVHPWKHFEILECFAEQKWNSWFFEILKKSYEKWIYEKDNLLSLSEELWAKKEDLEKCLKSEKYKSKILLQKERWINYFWVKSTPTSVFINSETGEYKIISWFDKSINLENFSKIIDDLK